MGGASGPLPASLREPRPQAELGPEGKGEGLDERFSEDEYAR